MELSLIENDCCRWVGVEDDQFGKGLSVGNWDEVEINKEEDEIVEDWEEFVAMVFALIPTQECCWMISTWLVYWCWIIYIQIQIQVNQI